MKISKLINYEQKIPAIGLINQKPINPNYNISYPVYNNSLNKDTVCFKSKNYKDLYQDKMGLELYERMEERPYTRFHSIGAYIEALSNFNVKDYIRLGGESAVFELCNGDILKLSCEEYPSYLAKYHAPEVRRGVIKLSKPHPAINIDFTEFYTDKIYYVIQKKGVLVIDSSQVSELWDMAKKENLNTDDFRCDQFAYFDTPEGKVVKCIDLGCITDTEYPKLRDFKAIEKMEPKDSCKIYGFLYFTLKKYFKDIFAEDCDKINSFVKSVEPRLSAGENIYDIVRELSLAIKSKKPIRL